MKYKIEKNLDINDINEEAKDGWRLVAVRGTDATRWTFSEIFYFEHD